VNSKKRVIKDYESLPEDIKNGIKMTYPRGFAQHLVYYTDRNGKRVSALPFETEDIYYLVRMTVREAVQIIEDDEDYDSEGVLRDDFSMSGSDDEEIFESVKEEEETPSFKEAPVSAYDVDDLNDDDDDDTDGDDDDDDDDEEVPVSEDDDDDDDE
jgi:DNA-directed RNA polymerase subunit delta